MLKAWRALRPYTAPFLTITIVTVFFIAFPSALVLSRTHDGDLNGGAVSWSNLTKNFIPFFLSHGIWILLSSILSIVTYHVLVWKGESGDVIQPFRDAKFQRRLGPALVWFSAGTLVVLLMTAALSDKQILPRVINNPGGLFAILTGVASLVGVYLTLATVLEVKNTILSFSDYIHRVRELIEETAANDHVRMMVHTPATGCLALPSETWMSLSKTIKTSTANYSLVCLSQTAMQEWFDRYKVNLEGRTLQEMEKRIREGLLESNLLKESIRTDANKIQDSESEVGVVETTWTELPTFYLVANRRRAIVVMPFFLPTPYENIFAQGENVHYRPVHMIGFETSNSHIIDTVLTEFSIRRSHLLNKPVTSGQSTP